MTNERNEKQVWQSENIFGWRFSFISLGFLLVGFLFLILVGPRREEATNLEQDRIEVIDSVKTMD